MSFPILCVPELLMEGVQPETCKVIEDNSSMQVDQETLNDASVFAIKGGLDCAFTIPTMMGVILLEEDKRTYNKLNGA